MPLMNAQEVRTNADGEKIIVYPDGSWKYFDEANRQSYETEANTEDLETQERNKAIQQAEKANAEAKALERLAEDATLQRLFLEEDYHFFINTNPDATDEDIKAKKQLITDAKKIENKAKKKAEEAKETAEDQEKLIYMSSKKRKKYLAKLADKQNEAIDSSKENKKKDTRVAKTKEPKRTQAEITNMRDVSDYAVYKPSQDVFLNPPSKPCKFQFDGIDEFSDQKRREVVPSLLFTSTREALRPYLKEKNHIECRGAMSSISGGLNYLTLEFTINSRTAGREFGGIPQGALLNILLLNGETIVLRNKKTDNGSYNPAAEKMSYRAVYSIDGGIMNDLKKNEVDKVRVFWRTGYEDYEVYELDFFRDQIECLKG